MMHSNTDIEIFCRLIRSRSNEHSRAMRFLNENHLAGLMVTILRQELDSMVRVIYLLQQPIERRNKLIQASVNGKEWHKENSKGRLTDREMVNLAQELKGWTQSVYKFGCAFIHLSAFHDYCARDPLQYLTDEEQQHILYYCRYYHGGPDSNHPIFSDYIPYLPRVFEKISSNLECSVKELQEAGGGV